MIRPPPRSTRPDPLFPHPTLFLSMGLKGPEIMRLIGQCVIPIGTATLAYFASDNAINEAIDLAGLSPTAKIAREVTDAFAPVYSTYYKKQGIKVLGFSDRKSVV